MILNILPLNHWFDLHDISFLVKCLKDPQDNIGISKFVSFTSSNTRATSHHHLKHNFARTSTARHFYFNCVVRLWNSLPHDIRNLNLSIETSTKLNNICGITSLNISTRISHVLSNQSVHVPAAVQLRKSSKLLFSFMYCFVYLLLFSVCHLPSSTIFLVCSFSILFICIIYSHVFYNYIHGSSLVGRDHQ